MNLKNKRALVTGATRGIGRAVAERLAKEGAAIAINGRSIEMAEQLAREIRKGGGEAVALIADVADPGEVDRLFSEAEARLGKLDIVASVAGTMRPAPLAEASVEDFDFNFAANAKGSFLTFAQAARRIADEGRIVGFSTNLTRLPRAGMGLYQASKAAVEQMAFSLARELGPRRVTVNVVSPGGTDTQMLSEARRREVAAATPLGRVADTRDIADVVAFLVSDEARWINGQVIGVNGGIV